LEAEGIIRDVEPSVTVPRALWWQGFAELFRPRALATVGAGLLVVLAGVYFTQHRGATPTQIAPPVQTQTQAKQTTPAVEPAPVQPKTQLPARNVPAKAPVTLADNTAPQPRPSSTQLKSSPSEDLLDNSAAVLNAAEGSLPSRELTNNAAVDASLRQNLRTLNEFIAECEARLKQNPQDEMTREYLNSAYQQKAELLTAMMDSGRSEH
jgi:hypothetical protein